MKIARLLVIVVCLSFVIVPGVVASDIDEAKLAIQKGIAAFNSGDLDTYFSSLTEDIEVYTGVHTPVRHEGMAQWKPFIQAVKDLKAVYEQRQVSYRAYNGDTVIANGYYIFTTVTPDGQATTTSGRATMVTVKVNGSWRIASMHFSEFF
jgi:ketosteroid isomerase-like protein